MPEFSSSFLSLPSCGVILPSNEESLGDLCGSTAGFVFGGAWPAGNLAIFYPFVLFQPFTFRQIAWLNGGTVSGNLDAGVYKPDGTLILSIGSTAQTGTSSLQAVSVTATTLAPGRYYMGFVLDNTTGGIANVKPVAPWLQAFQVQQMAAAFPLPSTATFANPANAYLPWGGLIEQAIV